jgi:hypothetical protein
MTITEYFLQAKADGYEWADNALRNRANVLNGKEDYGSADSLEDALSEGFLWGRTPEGSNYWKSVFRLLLFPKTKLTPEVLKEKGWKFRHKFQETTSFEKGNTWLDAGRGAFLDITGNEITIQTTNEGYGTDGPNLTVKFDGLCQTVEEFDMICKMINLKA